MSETPRTDALQKVHCDAEYSAWESCKSYREHAGTLERELTAANLALQEVRGKVTGTIASYRRASDCSACNRFLDDLDAAIRALP